MPREFKSNISAALLMIALVATLGFLCIVYDPDHERRGLTAPYRRTQIDILFDEIMEIDTGKRNMLSGREDRLIKEMAGMGLKAVPKLLMLARDHDEYIVRLQSAKAVVAMRNNKHIPALVTFFAEAGDCDEKHIELLNTYPSVELIKQVGTLLLTGQSNVGSVLAVNMDDYDRLEDVDRSVPIIDAFTCATDIIVIHRPQLRMRTFAAKLLARAGSSRADTYLRMALVSKPMLVRLSAADTIIKVGRRGELVKWLHDLINDDDDVAAYNALVTLQTIDPTRQKPFQELDYKNMHDFMFFEAHGDTWFSSLLPEVTVDGLFPHIHDRWLGGHYTYLRCREQVNAFFQQQTDAQLGRLARDIVSGEFFVNDNPGAMKEKVGQFYTSIRIRQCMQIIWHTSRMPEYQIRMIVDATLKPRLIWGLKHEDPRVRIVFLWLCKYCGGSLPLTEPLLKDPDSAVRKHARAVIGGVS